MDSKNLELKSKLELKDLLKAIDYLGNNVSSGDDIHTYSKSPIHVLVHNEILKHSKEDIDSCQEALRFGRNLYNVSFGIRNSYIFSAFLKVGAFQDKLSKESKWLLKSRKKPSNDLYDLVYMIEEWKINNGNRHALDELSHSNIPFNCTMDHYLYSLDNDEKKDVFNKYFKDFGKKMEEHFIEYVFHHCGRRADVCEAIVEKLKQNNVDLSKNDLLNRFLSEKKTWYTESSKFFISSTEIPRIKKLLEYGFRFDEKNYSYNGDNLFISSIKSERVDIITTIIPYLSDITPKSGTLDEQNSYIDSLAKEVNNSTDEEHYRLIKTNYQKCLLDHELFLKPSNTGNKRKFKL